VKLPKVESESRIYRDEVSVADGKLAQASLRHLFFVTFSLFASYYSEAKLIKIVIQWHSERIQVKVSCAW
jgi:hypothetical protein